MTDQQQQQPEGEVSDVDRLRAYCGALSDRLSARSRDRSVNRKEAIKYPEESFLSKQLDSSIKKNNAIVKRLRTNITESQREVILKELSGQNVSKYIGEICSALVESKIKMSDIPVILAISSHMHQRYPEFSATLLDYWSRVLPRKPTDMANINVAKLRTDVRVFADLISINIFSLKDGLPILGQCVKLLANSDAVAGDAASSGNANSVTSSVLPILLSFCKNCGEEFLGVIPYSMRVIADKHPDIEIPALDTLLTGERQKILLKIMQDYLKSLISRIHREKKELRFMDQQNRKMLMSRGEISGDRKEKYDQAVINVNKLIASAQQFAEAIGQEFPELPPDPVDVMSEFEAPTEMSIEISNRFRGGSELDPFSLFEDDDSRSFYQSIPDLKSQIPSILYKDSLKDGVKDADSKAGSPDSLTKDEAVPDDDVNVADKQDNEKDLLNTLTSTNPTDLLFVETDDVVEVMEVDEKPEESAPGTGDKPVVKASNKVLMDAFLSSLTSCISRDHVDKAALNFCTNLNTKSNRIKLIRTLFTVPRNRLDLLPFYARLVKTLQPIMPHVAADLVSALKQDFKFHVRKKDQINIESKMKTMRYIGELVKFELFSKSDALSCLKILLLDFTHHQITMACTLIEACGRFLYRSSDSHQRMNLLLEQMMRKKALLPYDSRYITQIENAYYSANTSDTGTGITRIERPVMHEYVRKLLYTDLSKRSVDRVCRQIRKLDWDDESLVQYVIKCIIAVYNVKYLLIGCMAHLLSQLKEFHEDAVYRVVDGVLEDMKLLMEVNHVKFHQRRISMVKFLGELYNYRLVDSTVVFQELYSFISFGVTYQGSNANSPIDPPDNLFRIRLICTLLDSCAAYFSSVATKRKLDCFLIYFQRYYWLKRSAACFAATGESNLTSATTAHSFPITIQNLFIDTIRSLRPKFKFADNASQATSMVQELVNELQSKVIQLYPHLKELQQQNQSGSKICGDVITHANAATNDLNAIPEEGEEDSNTEDHKEDEDCDDEEDDDGDSAGDDDSSSSSTSSGDEEDSNNNQEDEIKPCSPAKAKLVKCPEDDEFQKEFDKLMTESIMSRNTENVKPLSEIMIPIDYQNSGSSRGNQGSNNKADASVRYADSIAYPGTENTMKLTVMTRSGKGSNIKPVLKMVQVPLDSELAKELKEKEERHRREKEELKQLTLVMNDRIDEAEANQSPFPAAPGNSYMKNRNRHFRPKGAPDADLIFGANSSAVSGSNDANAGNLAISGSISSSTNPSSGQRYQKR